MFQHICYKFHIWLNVTYLLTPWSTVLLEKLTGFAANQEIPPVLWNNQKVHTVLTSARHLSLSWANSNIISLFLFLLHDASSRNTPPHPGDLSGGVFYLFTSGLFCLQRKHLAHEYFSIIFFHGEELLAPRPTPKLEDHPLSAVHDCLFNLFTATLHIRGRSSLRNLRTHHAVVTGTHKHGWLNVTILKNSVILKIQLQYSTKLFFLRYSCCIQKSMFQSFFKWIKYWD